MDARRAFSRPQPEEIPVGKRIIRLEEHGFRLSRRRGQKREGGSLCLYADITHVVIAPKAISVGMRRDTLLLWRRHFDLEDAPEKLAAALRRGILGQPGGHEHWLRIQAIDRRMASPAPRVATTSLVGICIALMLYQWFDPFSTDVGAFVPELVVRGEWWRVVSGNLLHSAALFPVHILSNVLLILGFAVLVERPLGPLRTMLVMAVAALAAMGSSAVAGYEEVVGASGIAAGLVGAALCLELRYGDRLPASWRLSRPLFITLLVLQGVFDLSVPFVAAAAHLGGFSAGYVATEFLAPAAFAQRPISARLRFVAGAIGAVVFASLLAPLPLLFRDGDALVRHAQLVLSAPERHAVHDNDLAWRMVTESDLSPWQAEVAVVLAERAVDRSERQNPDVLDTLAETLFVLGDPAQALKVIDEAIALSGGEIYFLEQRRRFSGERAAEDRPAPPFLPWILRQPETPHKPMAFDSRDGLEI